MSRPALTVITAGIVAAVITVTVALAGPPVSRTLVRWAARRCFDTEELRERFAEEWLADLEDVPGRLAKLAHAAGVLALAAAPIWARSAWRRSRPARRLDLGVLMAGARDSRRWPSAAVAADVLRSALRMRLRLPRPGTQSRRWSDAWAVFSVLGPVFVLLTNIVVVLAPPSSIAVWVKVSGHWELTVQDRWGLMASYAPYGFNTALICEATLVVLVLAGRRWASLLVLVASAALWVKSPYTFPPGVTLINTGAGILELGALAAPPGPRRGRCLLNWGHGVVLVLAIAAVKLSSIAFPALSQSPQLARMLLLSTGALVVITGAAAMRLRLGQHALWIGAALLYPYAIEFAPSLFGGASGTANFFGLCQACARYPMFGASYYLLKFPVTSLHGVVLFLGPAVMAVLAVLIAVRGRLALPDAGLAPGS